MARKNSLETALWFLIDSDDSRGGQLGQIYMADDAAEDAVIAAWRADLQRVGYSGYPQKNMRAVIYRGCALDSIGN